ncbi:hypothetical protein EVAR_23979_1 [Eumeta japonica]|uniref:Uncharacterized protein n=1 Tax=Eumeta variegata TaxID=151549 RepID=A0A4C1V2Q2_EUMVA|nr:hypothetical protein EVAR_23979_1 [Eumeta japonica]
MIWGPRTTETPNVCKQKLVKCYPQCHLISCFPEKKTQKSFSKARYATDFKTGKAKLKARARPRKISEESESEKEKKRGDLNWE